MPIRKGSAIFYVGNFSPTPLCTNLNSSDTGVLYNIASRKSIAERMGQDACVVMAFNPYKSKRNTP
jgi:hypothetical protein